MFERYSRAAREVVVVAQEEAYALRHEYLGTEHILLGVVQDVDGRPHETLSQLGLTIETARAEVVRAVGRGNGAISGQLPFTRDARETLELACREALALGDLGVEVDHLVLAVLRGRGAVAMRVLAAVGAPPADVRARILERRGSIRPDSLRRYMPYDLARRAVTVAADRASVAGRSVDPGDLIVALAKVDRVARRALTRYVAFDELVAALDEERRRGEGADDDSSSTAA